MADALAASRLGDLPNAGYASRRQKETTDAICDFMRKAERNRPLLLSIVLDGREKFRKVAGREWRGLLIDGDLLDSIFRYFVLQAGPNPAEQLLILLGQIKQQQVAQGWDRRSSTQLGLQKALRGTLADLRHDRKGRAH